MKLIEKYILRNLLSPIGFCFLLISSLYIVIDLSTKLEHIIKNKVGLTEVAVYYLYSLPQIIYQIIPLCLLVAVIYSLTKMNKFNEIVAMRASGISLLSILKPYITTSFLLIVLMFLNQEKLIPISSRKLKNIEYLFQGEKRKKVYNNVTFYAQGNRIIFAKSFYPQENRLEEVIILEQSLEKKVLYKIRAESAQYLKGKWILYNSVIYKLDPKGTGVEEAITLSRKEYELKESPRSLLASDAEITMQSYQTLKKKLANFRDVSEEIVRRIAVELYHKLSFPFTNFTLLLLGLFVGLRSRQVSLLKGLGISLIIGFGYYSLDAFAYSLGKVGLLPPFLGAFWANIFFLILGSSLLIRTLSG